MLGIKDFSVTNQSMAQIIEARLTPNFNSSEELFGVLHSKFSTVINVFFGMARGTPRLITFMTAGTKGVPDSITVTDEYFEKLLSLPVGSRVLCKDFIFYFDSILEELKGDNSCTRQNRIVFESTSINPTGLFKFIQNTDDMRIFSDKPYLFGNLSPLNTEQKTDIVSNLHGFAKSWLEHDIRKMESILLKHIGMGIGLTPSCDDAFLGIIAVYSGAKLYAETMGVNTSKFLREWMALPDIKNLPPFYRTLSNRTTDVSLKYLCCAQEGRFSDVVIDLIKGMFSKAKDLRDYIKAVSLVGGSSGLDMLYGMSVACQELSKSIN